MIRDRLVVGIQDNGLSERLQLSDADLKLEKAKKMIRQREAVHEQQFALKEEPVVLEEVQGNQGYFKRTNNQKRCSRCGRGPHPWDTCSTREAWCHHCKCTGHYKSQCQSKTIAEVRSEVHDEQSGDPAMDCAFLGGGKS